MCSVFMFTIQWTCGGIVRIIDIRQNWIKQTELEYNNNNEKNETYWLAPIQIHTKPMWSGVFVFFVFQLT